jgi:hypothetical protein
VSCRHVGCFVRLAPLSRFAHARRASSSGGGDRALSPVWLATFPNSGTSYTLTMVKRASDRAVATHYAAGSKHVNGTAISVYPDRPYEGPFWDGPGPDMGLAGFRPFASGWGGADRRPPTDEGSAPAAPRRRRRDLPDRYVLTKTHCGSRCAHCSPSVYLVNASEFARQCLHTHGRRDGQPYKSSIDADGVAKVVHLVRNPYHNVVARFHLDRRALLRRNSGFAELLPNNATGFGRWCRVLDKRYESRWHWDDAETQRLMDRVPCRGEFHRYALWHERALALPSNIAARQSQSRRRTTSTDSTDSTATATATETVPALILHYEDYQDWHNETASRLLSFLELEMVAPSLEPFRPLPSYEGYYQPDQVEAIRDLLRHLASDELWEILRRYF